MPRPRKERNCRHHKGDRVFKPRSIPMPELQTLVLRVDELEALRLCDLEGFDQEAAGERMGVSRGTVQRILKTARSTVVKAITENAALIIGGPGSGVSLHESGEPDPGLAHRQAGGSESGLTHPQAAGNESGPPPRHAAGPASGLAPRHAGSDGSGLAHQSRPLYEGRPSKNPDSAEKPKSDKRTKSDEGINSEK